jgi:hypothetical protein
MNLKISLMAGLMLTIASITVHAQTDTTYNITRNGKTARFTFLKIGNPTELTRVQASSLPLYGVSKSQFERIRLLLTEMVDTEQNYTNLSKNYYERDSVYREKERHMQEIYKVQEQRVENYKGALESAIAVNQQLAKQLDSAAKLAVKEHKKGRFNTFILGTLIALPAGIIIGVMADK